ncbi:hypothetical protein F25303_3802 [Fusarium sp. NRRL 25303]|nr:hypothetical protein F25303_3802 [Fusarium sp. NRRL 25303]
MISLTHHIREPQRLRYHHDLIVVHVLTRLKVSLPVVEVPHVASEHSRLSSHSRHEPTPISTSTSDSESRTSSTTAKNPMIFITPNPNELAGRFARFLDGWQDKVDERAVGLQQEVQVDLENQGVHDHEPHPVYHPCLDLEQLHGQATADMRDFITRINNTHYTSAHRDVNSIATRTGGCWGYCEDP